MMDRRATLQWKLNKIAKNSHGNASVFLEEVEQRQPWAVGVACITVCCANVRKESQIGL